MRNLYFLQAGGVHALGGDAPRHSDAVVARVAQQCREGVAHHAGYGTADESDHRNRIETRSYFSQRS